MSPFAKISFWVGFLVFFVGFLVVFNEILTPFVLGAAIAYLLNPIMRRLSIKRIPRWASALIILTVFLSFLFTIFVLVAPMAIRQGQMLIEQIPNYIQNTLDYLSPYLMWIQDRVGSDYVEQISAYLKSNVGKVFGVTGDIVGGIATGGKFVVGMASTLFLTPLVAFFMMNEWPNIVRWVESLFPRQHATVIKDMVRQIDRKLAGFIRGQITVAFVLGIIYAIALTVAGLNYGFLIGLGTGIFSIIPLVGSTLGLLISVIIAWFQTGDIFYTGTIAAIFFAGQFIEGNFLSPKLVGDSVGLHPLWIIFALLAGGSLFGILGMLLAVPVAAIIGVLMGFAIQQYKASVLYQRDAAEPVIIIEVDVNE